MDKSIARVILIAIDTTMRVPQRGATRHESITPLFCLGTMVALLNHPFLMLLLGKG